MCVCQEAKVIEIRRWLCCVVFFVRKVFNIIITLSFLARYFSAFFISFVRVLLIWLNGSWPQRIWSVIISYCISIFDPNGWMFVCSLWFLR